MTDEELPANPTDNQVRHTVDDEMRTSYINYAMSVIIGRALPEVRDGLKPVHRRVLFGMYEGGHTSDRSYSKSARSVGEVMGKYHPHGDASIYDTMVRLAQDFSLRYPLIDGQGNFGSIDGDKAAAMRYTESRLDRLAKHMLEDIKKETVNFQPNFDDSEQEPEVLPARLPNLLLNGSDGIAVGMATKIPPHNLTEVASAIQLHVERILEEGGESGDLESPPNIDIAEYMQHLKGPDLPTGATIHGIDGIRDMYETGKGRFHIRAQCEVFDDDKGKRIIITEIPYQVKKSGMLEGIAELVSKETVKGIRDIRDESSKEGIRVLIEVKQNADPHAVLNQLYRSSRLQESYSANMMGIMNREPVQLTLPVILHAYVRHREEVIRRRTQFDLAKAEARAHVLEGLVKAQARIDDVVAAGKGADSREHFEQILRGEVTFGKLSAFDFSEPQAKAIAERRLYQLSKMDTQKVDDEFSDLKIAIAEYNAILASRQRQLQILLAELEEMVEKHGDERRTDIDPMPLSMDREDLVEERAIVISLSEDDYIRHLPVETFRVQNRGGKGIKGVATKEEDVAKTIVSCFSKDRILIFTNKPFEVDEGHSKYNKMDGRVYGIKAWETPQASRQSKGSHIRNVLNKFQDNEKIVSILPISREMEEEPDGHYIFFATKLGKVKKTSLEAFIKINKNGKRALILPEGDELVSVRHGKEDSHVILISSQGRALRFKPSTLIEKVDKETGEIKIKPVLGTKKTNTQPNNGMKLISSKGEKLGELVGMIVSDDDDTGVLTISKYGMAKRTRVGTGLQVKDTDSEGNFKYDDDGNHKMRYDGFKLSKSKGNQGNFAMYLRGNGQPVGLSREKFGKMSSKEMIDWHNSKFPENTLKTEKALQNCWPGDEIVRVHQVPNEGDQIFLLAESGMMIRLHAAQTKETLGKSIRSAGTRVMEVRDKKEGGFSDCVISSARLPAELIDDEDEFDSMDTNQDGVIDREEFEAAQQEQVDD